MERIIHMKPWMIILGLILCCTACKKKEKEKPELATESQVQEASENTEDFFEALEDHDFEKAKDYVTIETQPMLETVMTDAKKQEDEQGKKPEIKVVILEGKPLIGKVNLKVKIRVGAHEKVETLTLVPVEDGWLLILPSKKLSLLKLVVIYQPYEVIIIKEKKRKKQHGRGHAYGHHKHSHDHDDHDED